MQSLRKIFNNVIKEQVNNLNINSPTNNIGVMNNYKVITGTISGTITTGTLIYQYFKNEHELNVIEKQKEINQQKYDHELNVIKKQNDHKINVIEKQRWWKKLY